MTGCSPVENLAFAPAVRNKSVHPHRRTRHGRTGTEANISCRSGFSRDAFPGRMETAASPVARAPASEHRWRIRVGIQLAVGESRNRPFHDKGDVLSLTGAHRSRAACRVSHHEKAAPFGAAFSYPAIPRQPASGRSPARNPRRRAAYLPVCFGSGSRLKLIVVILRSRPWMTSLVRSFCTLPPSTESRFSSRPQWWLL